jgi:hypothetical protein
MAGHYPTVQATQVKTYPIHLLLCLLLESLEAVVHGRLERGGSGTGRVLWR